MDGVFEDLYQLANCLTITFLVNTTLTTASYNAINPSNVTITNDDYSAKVNGKHVVTKDVNSLANATVSNILTCLNDTVRNLGKQDVSERWLPPNAERSAYYLRHTLALFCELTPLKLTPDVGGIGVRSPHRRQIDASCSRNPDLHVVLDSLWSCPLAIHAFYGLEISVPLSFQLEYADHRVSNETPDHSAIIVSESLHDGST